MFQRLAVATAVMFGSVSVAFADCDCCGGKCGTKTAMKKDGTFGIIETPRVDDVKAQAEKWLKSVKNDAETMRAFDQIWQSDSPVLDRVTKTLVLGDPAAAKLMAEAVNVDSPAPTAIPEAIKDAKQSSFYRANLGLAYAKGLIGRRVHEEALATLEVVKPEETADPAGFYFHKAVAEHALLKRDDAARSILCVLDNVPDAPERYRLVGTLMLLDMTNWKDKDLGWINRKMNNIERRLDLARGGPQTQKMQREVLHRLDEMIKELEKQCDGGGGGGGGCPGGGCPGNKPGAGDPTSPMPDSQIGGNSGEGKVDEKKLKELYKEWGKMPEKDKAEAISSRIKDLPPHLREVAKDYFDRMSRGENK